MPGWRGSDRQSGIQKAAAVSSANRRSCGACPRNVVRVAEDAGLKVALPRATTDVVITLHELSYQFCAPTLGHDWRDELCSPLLHTPQSSYDSFTRTTERGTKKTRERCGLQTRPDVRHALSSGRSPGVFPKSMVVVSDLEKYSPKMSSAYTHVSRLYHQYVPPTILLEPQKRPQSAKTPRKLDADENTWIQPPQPDECDRLSDK